VRYAFLRGIWPAVVLVLLGGLQAPSARASGGSTAAVVERLGHTVMTEGNSVHLLREPDQAYRARLDLVRNARHHIFLSVPIWRLDGAGMRFLGEFCSIIRRKREENPRFTVQVELDRVTFLPSHDWLGVVKRQLRKAGAQVRFFNPGTWVATPIYAARQHDKILIADGTRDVEITTRAEDQVGDAEGGVGDHPLE
jgi:phosphatidylserine/phosphatidylglycerophosphate/cardiolipin synthase-like enzyme